MVRANQGNSHSEYCGEYTLLVSRKQISRGTPIVQRGNDGSRRAFHKIATNAVNRNRASANRLTLSMEMHVDGQCRHATYHALSKSGVRPPLNEKNVDHGPHRYGGVAHPPDGSTMNGRFTATQVPADHQSNRIDRSGSRSCNPWRNSGTSSSAG